MDGFFFKFFCKNVAAFTPILAWRRKWKCSLPIFPLKKKAHEGFLPCLTAKKKTAVFSLGVAFPNVLPPDDITHKKNTDYTN